MGEFDTYVEENDRAVSRLLELYDSLVEATEAYMASLRGQREVAAARENVTYVKRVDRSLEQSMALLNALDNGALEALMELRHFASHMRIAKDGKLV
jgi:hypothetical protein